MEGEHLADVLEEFLKDKEVTPDWVARRAGLSRSTVRHWVEGTVKKPRRWQDVIKVASALNLTESEATRLLTAAGHLSVPELLSSLPESNADRRFLQPWAQGLQQRLQRAPFQVISDIPHFVGRRALLNELKAALLRPYHHTIYSLEGMGGSGKTVLAAHLAYELRPGLPGGVLWARVDTADPMSVLAAFAAAYEEDVSQYRDIESRSQVVRNILADKRALMVLDNVQNDGQIKYLLPPTGPCAVLLTTRNPELWATRNAHRVSLGPFDKKRGESRQLFTVVLGQGRVFREKVQFRQIAELLGHLPLAVDIMASRMKVDGGRTTTAFLEKLKDARERVNLLVYGEESVRLSFDLSYDLLSEKLKQFFAVLGVFGGDDFGVDAVAAVAQEPVGEADVKLQQLYELSLIQRARPGRYQLHPLLRDYALEKLQADQAYHRLVSFYVDLSERSERDFDTLDLELGNIRHALQVASEQAMNELFIRGVNAIYAFLDVRGMYSLAESNLRQAETLARATSMPAYRAKTLLNLGRILNLQAKYPEAETHFTEGLALAREYGLTETTAGILMGLGTSAYYQGQADPAEAYFQEGLVAARKANYQRAIIVCLDNLALADFRRGDLDKAEAGYLEALALAREIKDPESESHLLQVLGALEARRGHHDAAEKYYLDGLSIARNLKFKERISALLANLAELTCTKGDPAGAMAYMAESLAIAREIGHRERICLLLANMAEVAMSQGDDQKAEVYLREAVEGGEAIGPGEATIWAIASLGTLRTRAEDYVEAERFLDRALQLATDTEHPWLTSAVCNKRGDLRLNQDRFELAGVEFSGALRIARELKDPDLIGQALFGLAKAQLALGNNQDARDKGSESYSILQGADHYRTEEVRRWLDQLPPVE